MTPATILAPGGRVTLTASPTPMHGSGARLVPTEGRRLPRTFRSAPERPTPMMRRMALTTATTRGCRSTPESHIRHGPTIQIAPGTILTALSTSSIYTARACRCADDTPLSVTEHENAVG